MTTSPARATIRLDRATARAVIALANRAPSVHNSQPWRWRISPSAIHLFADPERALPRPTRPAGTCGSVAAPRSTTSASRCARPATAHGYACCPTPRPLHLAAVETFANEPLPVDLALARAIEMRAAENEGAELRVLTHETDRRVVAELVGRAAVEQALTPGYAQEIAAWTGRARQARDGVPGANVPTEPTGAVPMRHFAGGEQPQNRLGHGESDGTVLVLLATAGDGLADQHSAGTVGEG